MQVAILLILFLYFSVGALTAAPFGVKMGASLQSLEELGFNPLFSEEHNLYVITPKKTHPDFKLYTVHLDADEGVYMITALGKTIHDNRHGSNTQKKVENLSKAIDHIYGESKVISTVVSHAQYGEEHEWLPAVNAQERTHIVFWSQDTGAKLPSHIDKIILKARATSPTEGYVLLFYYAKNYDELSEQADRIRDSVF